MAKEKIEFDFTEIFKDERPGESCGGIRLLCRDLPSDPVRYPKRHSDGPAVSCGQATQGSNRSSRRVLRHELSQANRRERLRESTLRREVEIAQRCALNDVDRIAPLVDQIDFDERPGGVEMMKVRFKSLYSASGLMEENRVQKRIPQGNSKGSESQRK